MRRILDFGFRIADLKNWRSEVRSQRSEVSNTHYSVLKRGPLERSVAVKRRRGQGEKGKKGKEQKAKGVRGILDFGLRIATNGSRRSAVRSRKKGDLRIADCGNRKNVRCGL